MNPYNLGFARNIKEIFCSTVPSSKNNFREKVKVDSSSMFATSMPLARTMSPEMPKSSFDIEMGKRKAVAAEDFQEIQDQIDSIGGLERCGTQPRRTTLDEKANWEITSDVQMMVSEFGTQQGFRR